MKVDRTELKEWYERAVQLDREVSSCEYTSGLIYEFWDKILCAVEREV